MPSWSGILTIISSCYPSLPRRIGSQRSILIMPTHCWLPATIATWEVTRWLALGLTSSHCRFLIASETSTSPTCCLSLLLLTSKSRVMWWPRPTGWKLLLMLPTRSPMLQILSAWSAKTFCDTGMVNSDLRCVLPGYVYLINLCGEYKNQHSASSWIKIHCKFLLRVLVFRNKFDNKRVIFCCIGNVFAFKSIIVLTSNNWKIKLFE